MIVYPLLKLFWWHSYPPTIPNLKVWNESHRTHTSHLLKIKIIKKKTYGIQNIYSSHQYNTSGREQSSNKHWFFKGPPAFRLKISSVNIFLCSLLMAHASTTSLASFFYFRKIKRLTNPGNSSAMAIITNTKNTMFSVQYVMSIVKSLKKKLYKLINTSIQGRFKFFKSMYLHKCRVDVPSCYDILSNKDQGPIQIRNFKLRWTQLDKGPMYVFKSIFLQKWIRYVS